MITLFIDTSFSDVSIALLEPFGVANKKPLFAINANNLNANRIKPESPHVTINGTFIDLMYFSGADSLDFLHCDCDKTIVFEPTISIYNNNI